tara:strand:+ start:150 stop:515 length:366 start_codon:yes stop_codon:yes gene_type:complete
MNEKNHLNLQILYELNLQFDYSKKVYEKYLNSSRLFIYAKLLFEVNQRIYDLLIQSSSNFDQNIQKDIIEILFHLDVWSSLWVEEFESQKPKLRDVFYFDNETHFPKESVKRLLSCIIKNI